MPKYVIKRSIPGIGKMSDDEQRKVAEQSNRVLNSLGPDIQWLHSYVREEGTHCVYIAKNEEIIHKHAEISGASVLEITRVETIIDPTTAEG
ncbi:DUF4242 domain-containing protein [Rhodohalobacter mucosus]|uniref:DUF4242 domain-containing protein n=1 Tax=Rhodohalobacter mucosus TaxID=2079485 RepID=A0A316TTL3_9BACT|nr:DUF4242 domain-containing protein [Rhodohalobacter mucosus]PWN06315.1 DUF4242 domain-containing protein [Rhodohalobacter mucosus]